MIADEHAPLFPVELVAKDLRYAEAAASAAGSEVPTSSAVRAVFERAADAGLGELNLTAVARLFG
jgi:3-hydroxyisobutyrate dehydrogenase-like beta-hydroxyacid dehydrogenase